MQHRQHPGTSDSLQLHFTGTGAHVHSTGEDSSKLALGKFARKKGHQQLSHRQRKPYSETLPQYRAMKSTLVQAFSRLCEDIKLL